MKKTIIFAAAVLISGTAMAQVFSLGPRLGVSSSKVQVDEFLSGERRLSEGDKVLGFHAGLYSRIQIPGIGLYVQPEALFTSTGGKILIEEGGAVRMAEYTFNRLDVPVMVGVRFFRVLRINAGPTFNFLLSAREQIDDQTNSVMDDHNRSTVGYQAGIGLDIWRFILDLKYEDSLSKFGNRMFGVPTDHRNPQFIFSLGFRL
jgi:hypothetical protein